MLKTNEDIIKLINKSFDNPIVNLGGCRGGVVVKFKGSSDECSFAFETIKEKDPYCAEWFRGHLCLSFGVTKYNHNSGLGYMVVADEKDLSSDIIDFITTHLTNAKRKSIEQLSVFDFIK